MYFTSRDITGLKVQRVRFSYILFDMAGSRVGISKSSINPDTVHENSYSRFDGKKYSFAYS